MIKTMITILFIVSLLAFAQLKLAHINNVDLNPNGKCSIKDYELANKLNKNK